jgi:ArsR family transcriptional regulator
MGCCSKSISLASLFAALADTTRLRLLNLMAGREVCVCHFVEILGQSQPKISRHLAYLRNAGIVTARREGKWMHYSICPVADASASAVLAASLAALGSDKQMQVDRASLDRVCCATHDEESHLFQEGRVPQVPLPGSGKPQPSPSVHCR